MEIEFSFRILFFIVLDCTLCFPIHLVNSGQEKEYRQKERKSNANDFNFTLDG